VPLVATNIDGTRVAVQFVAAGASQLILLDAALNQIAASVFFNAQSLAFSRDGNFLYASETASGPPLISVFHGHTMQSIGQLLTHPSKVSILKSKKPTRPNSFSQSAIAASVLSTRESRSASLVGSILCSAPAAQPSLGAFTGGTSAVLVGPNFEAGTQVRFGPWLAAAPTVSPTQIQITAPPSITNGGVNLTAYFPSGWLAIAPDAFSYGPQILKVLPNAGSKIGGETIQIYGYGFGSDATQLSAKIGGRTSNHSNIGERPVHRPSLSLDSTYPFSLQRITLLTPLERRARLT